MCLIESPRLGDELFEESAMAFLKNFKIDLSNTDR